MRGQYKRPERIGYFQDVVHQQIRGDQPAAEIHGKNDEQRPEFPVREVLFGKRVCTDNIEYEAEGGANQRAHMVFMYERQICP